MSTESRSGVGPSPNVAARIAGACYLITIILGAAGEMWFRGSVYVANDAAATAANLKSMELFWRFGIVAEMAVLMTTVVTMSVLYALLKPVSRLLAMMMMLFAMIGLTIEAAYSLHLVEALFPLGKAAYLKAFTPDQLAAMASLAIRSHSVGFGIALLFFAPFFLIAGYLIYKSGDFPKAIGLLYLLPGVSYGASSLALILAPAFASRYYFAIAGPAIIGEGALCLWLLVKGVRAASWEDLNRMRIPLSEKATI
jgi:hypothetical protein